jgi:hypothetical protein
MVTIPFDEIAPGASVRLACIDGVQYLSIRDLLMHVHDKNPRRALEIWERMPVALKEEVSAYCADYKFPGQGQQIQTVITFKGAIKLIMMLSGEKAALYRTTMVSILSRYYAGDGSLTDEIEANATSTSPVAQMARSSLAAEGAVENPKKRARISAETFCTEVSVMLKTMETELTGQLRSIAAGQEEMAVKCTQFDAKQDNITNTLRELSAELKARQNQIERQTVAIAHLNNTIRAKDALLVKAENAHESIHQKLDALLARNG